MTRNRLTDYGDAIDRPCKGTLAAHALYRVDAFEDELAALDLRSASVSARELAVGVRERMADLCDRKLYAVCAVTLLIHAALALWQRGWV